MIRWKELPENYSKHSPPHIQENLLCLYFDVDADSSESRLTSHQCFTLQCITHLLTTCHNLYQKCSFLYQESKEFASSHWFAVSFCGIQCSQPSFNCCQMNFDIFSCFLWLDQKLFPMNEWGKSTSCLILIRASNSLNFQNHWRHAVVSCILRINLMHIMSCYYYSTTFIKFIQQCTHHLSCYTISDIFINSVLSETVCIYMLNIYMVYYDQWFRLSQCHVRRLFR